MNQDKLRALIAFYKANMDGIFRHESYKWRALYQFQNWDMDAMDFPSMLSIALSKTGNLLSSGNYYPLRQLTRAAKVDPEGVREAFRMLYAPDSLDANTFRDTIGAICAEHGLTDKNDQDHRAISVYLFLRYPERYYLYKYQMLQDFARFVELGKLPPKGEWARVEFYFDLCEQIRKVVESDTELIEIYGDRRDIDPAYHLLVQDVIYSVYYHEHPDYLSEKRPKLRIEKMSYVASEKDVTKGKYGKIDYLAQERRNKAIGDAGEEYVLRYEKERLKHAGIRKTPIRVSLTNDGAGYDILSYDKNGREKYIEVKTCKGPRNTPFFISANEYKTSLAFGDRYFLYRVYDYDMKRGDGNIDIHMGPLDDLCILPSVYKVIPKE